MTITVDVSKVEQVTKELNNVLEQFSKANHIAEITTSSGRTYRVVQVKQFDGKWFTTHVVSSSMFLCDKCSPPRPRPGDYWLQFSHGEKEVKMHCSLIHFFRDHPTEVPEKSLQQAASVFLD